MKLENVYWCESFLVWGYVAVFWAREKKPETINWHVTAARIALTRACELHFRREMMPLLSLVFSALFILFGTVIVQAFR